MKNLCIEVKWNGPQGPRIFVSSKAYSNYLPWHFESPGFGRGHLFARSSPDNSIRLEHESSSCGNEAESSGCSRGLSTTGVTGVPKSMAVA